MSTKAGTIGFSGRSTLFTFWTVAVTVLAAAAIILSGLALTVAAREDRSVASVDSVTRAEASIPSPLWDAGKLEAMEARMLAEAARAQGVSGLWDAHKLEAMEARMLAEVERAQATGAAP